MRDALLSVNMTGVWSNAGGGLFAGPPTVVGAPGTGSAGEGTVPFMKRARADGLAAMPRGAFLPGANLVGPSGGIAGAAGIANAAQMPPALASTASGPGITSYSLEAGFVTNPTRTTKWTAALGIGNNDEDLVKSRIVFVNAPLARSMGTMPSAFYIGDDMSVPTPFTDLQGVNYFLALGSMVREMRKQYLRGNIDRVDVPARIQSLVVDSDDLDYQGRALSGDSAMMQALFAYDGEDAADKWRLMGAVVSGPTSLLQYGVAVGGYSGVRNVWGADVVPGIVVGFAATRVPNPFQHVRDPSGSVSPAHLMGVPILAEFNPEYIIQMVPYALRDGVPPGYFARTPFVPGLRRDAPFSSTARYDLTSSLISGVSLPDRQKWWKDLRAGTVAPCLTWDDERFVCVPQTTGDLLRAPPKLKDLRYGPDMGDNIGRDQLVAVEALAVAEASVITASERAKAEQEMGERVEDDEMKEQFGIRPGDKALPPYFIKTARMRGAWQQLGRVMMCDGPTRPATEPADIRERAAYDHQPLMKVDINIRPL